MRANKRSEEAPFIRGFFYCVTSIYYCYIYAMERLFINNNGQLIIVTHGSQEYVVAGLTGCALSVQYENEDLFVSCYIEEENW